MITNDCPVQITPFDKSRLIKNPNIFNLNYTNQDFWSMKTRLVDFINSKFGTDSTSPETRNTFNDLVESSIAIMLIENWAFLADTLSFKMDQIVNELFIDTVTEIENAFRLAKLVGFQPQPPIAARAFFTASIINPLTDDIRISTPVSIDLAVNNKSTTIELFSADSADAPIFDEDIVIPAGTTTIKNIIGLEGRTVNDSFIGTGETGQTYQLITIPVIFDSVRVFVDGVAWTQVDFFTDSQPRREYRVEFDSTWTAFIIFGNNRAGLSPSNGSQILVTYRIGGGIAGNVVTGIVDKQVQATAASLQFNIPVSFLNYTKGEFGYDGDTIDDIRIKLPLYLRTQNRAVTGDDYKTLTDQFATPYYGKIGKSTATLRNYGCSGNIIDIYILALENTDDLTLANNDLKVALLEMLNSVKMITDFICIRDGSVVLTDVSIDLTLDKFYKKFELELKNNIQQKVTTFFSLNNWNYGQTLKDTDIIKEITGIKEIQSIDITFTTDSTSGQIITTKYFEIIRPDNINISFNYN